LSPLPRALVWLAALTATLAAARARAADPALNVGAIEVVSAPDGKHLGAYPYVAGSLAFPFKRVTLIPGLGIEASPDAGRWGLVGSLVADFPIRGRVGLDLLVVAIHDQSGLSWADALFFFGGGIGASVTVERWILSPSVCVFYGLSAPGWSVVPGLNLSYPL
jgi:hypothetical protein